MYHDRRVLGLCPHPGGRNHDLRVGGPDGSPGNGPSSDLWDGLDDQGRETRGSLYLVRVRAEGFSKQATVARIR